jgi:hypothetical protein
VRIGPELLLVGAVIAVGILHTLVPDHWVPIAVLARQRRWPRLQTARAAAVAGLGHTLSTLAIGVAVWWAGVAVAVRFGNVVSLLSGIALIVFGLWMAIASLLEMRDRRSHLYEHDEDKAGRRPGARTALLLILGSSPMIEGIPAFFAAGRFGAVLLVIMAVCFALSTVATYVVTCVYSHAALEGISFGSLERYGEVLSGAIIAAVGSVFLFWSPA